MHEKSAQAEHLSALLPLQNALFSSLEQTTIFSWENNCNMKLVGGLSPSGQSGHFKDDSNSADK